MAAPLKWLHYGCNTVPLQAAPLQCRSKPRQEARADIDTAEITAKAAAAVNWCRHASKHAVTVGGKPWKYLLAPHDEIAESKRLVDFLRFEVKA